MSIEDCIAFAADQLEGTSRHGIVAEAEAELAALLAAALRVLPSPSGLSHVEENLFFERGLDGVISHVSKEIGMPLTYRLRPDVYGVPSIVEVTVRLDVDAVRRKVRRLIPAAKLTVVAVPETPQVNVTIDGLSRDEALALLKNDDEPPPDEVA